MDSELLRRNPLIDDAGVRMLHRLREHPDAPRWNHAAGDRLERGDLEALDHFRADLVAGRGARRPGPPPPFILAHVAALRPLVPSFRRRLPARADLERDWASIPTMAREDVALAPEELVPEDLELDRLIVYRTAGTSGHALRVPHHPVAVAAYLALIEHALARYGVRPGFGPEVVGCFLIGAQARTVTFPTVLSAWKGAGFAKLNLTPPNWPRPESPHNYFGDLAPLLLTGDPISFAEMLRLQVPARPAALITTAVALGARLKQRLADRYGCPVIDWYSLTETGPIGYACPRGDGFHLLPHDLHVETVDEQGRPVTPGARGEITVTGGRNPFLPLLRYRTGDWGRLDYGACPCGDPMPRLRELEGRAPVLFRAEDGSVVNPVDLSRVLRDFPFVQHEFLQRADRSCALVARVIPDQPAPDRAAIERVLRRLLGAGLPLEVRFDPHLGDRTTGGKTMPYRSELLLEE